MRKHLIIGAALAALIAGPVLAFAAADTPAQVNEDKAEAAAHVAKTAAQHAKKASHKAHHMAKKAIDKSADAQKTAVGSSSPH